MACYNPNNLSPDELSCPICFEEYTAEQRWVIRYSYFKFISIDTLMYFNVFSIITNKGYYAAYR